MEELPTVERSTDIPVSVEKAWDALVDGSLSGDWLGIIIEPKVGGEVTDVDREMIGVVEEIDDGASVTWTWRRPDGEPSQVTITLEPTGEGSTIHVVERMLPYEFTHYPPIIASSLAA